MDAAVSITLDGRPIGIFLCGQVFFEPPKEEPYRQKAKELGIDEEAYLKAIQEVPVVPKERFEAGVELMRQTARMLAEAGRKSLEHQKAIEARADQGQAGRTCRGPAADDQRAIHAAHSRMGGGIQKTPRRAP